MANGNGTRSGEPSRNGRERLEMESWQFKWTGKDVGGCEKSMRKWGKVEQGWKSGTRWILHYPWHRSGKKGGGCCCCGCQQKESESRSNIICMCLYIVSRCTCSACCWSPVLFSYWFVFGLDCGQFIEQKHLTGHVQILTSTGGGGGPDRRQLPGNRKLVMAFTVSMILLLLQK